MTLFLGCTEEGLHSFCLAMGGPDSVGAGEVHGKGGSFLYCR